MRPSDTNAGCRGLVRSVSQMACRRGYCQVCWLVPSDQEWLERLTAEHGRLPKHVLRRLGITKWCWWRHKHGRCRGQLPYFTQPEWDRRRFNCVERLRPWRWKPGFCPNPAGRPKGAKDKRPRAKAGTGVVELIRTRRAENAARWRMMQAAELSGE